MFFQQYYLQCLSHASYLIGDETTGRAVVVDPQRDVSQYLADAEAHGLKIERVIETHFHADFLSGHLELQSRCGAVIHYGEAAKGAAEFEIETVADGQRISLGEVTLEIRATPGHTPESISVVVYEHPEDAVPYGVLTGDTLFIGDVGRPDLLASRGVTAEQLARQLYHSLHEKLLSLPDETRVLPAHGAGSACGKALSSETVSTIGEQRRANYALQPMTEDEFVKAVTEGQSTVPLYFPFSADRNKRAHELLAEDEAPPALTLDEVIEQRMLGAVVLDTRDPADFALAHLRGSINVGLGGRFAEYAGDVIRAYQPIVLICDGGHEIEARNRLARIGFDRIVGCLTDPLATFVEHPEVVAMASRLSVEELVGRREQVADLQIIDVREIGEARVTGHIPGARQVPLPKLLDTMAGLDPRVPTVVNCAGGYRSMIASSVLRAHGFRDVSDLIGGFDAWAMAGQPSEPLEMVTP